MKVALVHDYLIRFGGAERVLLELARMFPDAPIYTFLYDREKMGGWFAPERVRTSFLQKFPKFLRARQKYFLPLMPVAPEGFDLREFDLVVSSCSAFSKGVITRPNTVHISYTHNAARFFWDYAHAYLKEQNLNWAESLFVKTAYNYFRIWDRSASKRVDFFIANSKSTADRIAKYYRRPSKVIYPPVGSAASAPSVALPSYEAKPRKNGYFLIVSQLTPYKKVDIAVEAFNKLELPLVVIGEGPQKKYLRKIAKANIEILGWQNDGEVNCFFKNCFALIFPGEDDFGITPVEAMKFGKPVLAFRAGGALETVLPGISGELFDAPVAEVLADGVRRLRANFPNYSPLVIKKWAEKFSEERFRREMMEYIQKLGYN